MLKAVIFHMDTMINTRENRKKKEILPVPGLISLIKTLHRGGIFLAFVSSSSTAEIETLSKALSITNFFDIFVSELDFTPMPAPDILLEILSKLGVSFQESIVISGSQRCCLGAKAGNIPCIAYIHPDYKNENLYSAMVAVESMTVLSLSSIKDVLLRANGLPLTIIKTKRLLIRELALEDIKPLYALYQHREIAKYTDNEKDTLAAATEKYRSYIKHMYPFYGYGLWGVFHKKTGALIGCCGIQNQFVDDKPEIELSYVVDPTYWRNGYAMEACKSILHFANTELQMNRIVAAIDKDNLPSLCFAKKLGMHLEKDILYKKRICSLYVIQLENERYINARNQVLEQYRQKPDTTVYGRRYFKSSQEKK
ncbi:MAG: GNAT family N-acetyltransferase [Acetivibrio sp.]